ncbi:hypothetical protein B0T11DRAFT_282887 [Plectosphaerella cucumerina]|uniref:Kelch repeat protein n=1 Tax=Plectosphaerella cucumerina TaxID=40658 RepID=A0A8K0X4C7_9PEZI|nr:hypothetical protein B0T11DRAFT_282887 [Plectosphaerella cucumerina]
MMDSLTLALCSLAAYASVASAQFEGWVENQVNASICLWAQPRGAVIRDTVYLDGGFLYWSQGLLNGEYGAPEQQENPLGLMYTLNFSRPFQTFDNLTALFGTVSKARGGVGNSNNDAPNYYDGAMLANDAQLSLYGGLVRKTDAFQPPRADDVLTYQAYQYGPLRDQFEPGFVSGRLPEGMTRYVAYGGVANAPSENMAWYFGGLRAPQWGEVFQRNANLTENAVNASDTLLTLDMRSQTNIQWRNDTLPGEVRGRANPEAVWLPVGERGVLVVIGGVTYPDWLTSTRRSEDAAQSKADGDEFMRTIDVYDVANGTWYRQATSGGPAARTRACAVAAPAGDLSSINIYLYGGYPGVDPTVEMNDEVWVLSLPSFTWTRISEGRPGQGRSGHKCFMPYPDQMMVVGGMTSLAGDDLTCLPSLIQVYNLTSGRWMDGYDPDKHADYGVPAAVREVIGGSAEGGATLMTPEAGWSDERLADVFATPYPTSKIQTWHPYPRAPEAGRPTIEPGGDVIAGGDDGGGVPKWVGPTLGVVLGLLFTVLLVGGIWFCRRRRKPRREGVGTEDKARIMSWMRGQPTLQKPSTVTSSDADAVAEQAATTPSVPPPEMMHTPIVELHDTSAPPELSDTGLTHVEVIEKHTHFGARTHATSIQPTYFSSSIPEDARSVSPSSGVFGPESPGGFVSPIDEVMEARMFSGFPLASGDGRHLRQTSEVTVSSTSNAGELTSTQAGQKPRTLDFAATRSEAADSRL